LRDVAIAVNDPIEVAAGAAGARLAPLVCDDSPEGITCREDALKRIKETAAPAPEAVTKALWIEPIVSSLLIGAIRVRDSCDPIQRVMVIGERVSILGFPDNASLNVILVADNEWTLS
jgi:hypothetical protein